MAWDTEMIEILRVLVNDMGDTPSYSNERLRRVLVVAALQVSGELSFSHDFKVKIEQPSIIPDPTDEEGGSRDESFINLCCLKAACIIDRGAAILAAKQAIAIKDGSSAIDLRGNLQGKLKLLEKGWCAVYEDAKIEYLTSHSGGIAGAAVMTPFRLYARGGYTHSNLFGTERSRDIYL